MIWMHGTRRNGMSKLGTGMVAAAMLVGSLGFRAAAQTSGAAAPVPDSVHTFYLTNVSQQTDANDVLSAIRNMLAPSSKVYFVPGQNALLLRASPEELAIAQKLLSDLDRPRKTYRLTYTITETDAGKRIGVQHFAMVVVSGQRTTLKQGSKIPVVTGTYNPGTSSAQQQFTYLDIGLNFDATLDESASGVRLRTKAERSSLAEDSPNMSAQDPIVRQTVLEGTSILTPGKPLVLGSLDISGSTRHLDLEVMMEVVR